jgi:hypothetical protein
MIGGDLQQFGGVRQAANLVENDSTLPQTVEKAWASSIMRHVRGSLQSK